MEKYTSKSFLQSINEDRFIYYGIAILLVVLYQLHCYTKLGIVAPFSQGAIGVDIFLFFSGYGLCFSYEKNSLKEFYWRRFKRIIPLFWIHFFLTVIEYLSCGGQNLPFLSFSAIFCASHLSMELEVHSLIGSRLLLFSFIFFFLFYTY